MTKNFVAKIESLEKVAREEKKLKNSDSFNSEDLDA
jgi:hypothetical protein